MATNREILARHIIDRFSGAIAGTDITEYVDCNPEDKIFIGKLSPQSMTDGFSSSVLIKQISIDFRIPLADVAVAKLRIFPQGNFFYRAIPTLAQQREIFIKEIGKLIGQELVDFDALLSKCTLDVLNDTSGNPIETKRSLLPVYKKVALDSENVFFEVSVGDIYDANVSCGGIPADSSFNREIQKHIDRLYAVVAADPTAISCQFRDKINITDLKNEESWQAYIAKQTKREEFRMFPRFEYSISVDVKKNDNLLDITIALSNETMWGDETTDRSKSKEETKKDSYRINTLFNSGIKVQCIGTTLMPIELDYFANDYKYDRNVYALGNNCNVECNNAHSEVATTHLPCFIQNRLKTNDALSVKFRDLITNTIPTLKQISFKMDAELKIWRDDFSVRRGGLTEQGIKQFNEEISRFDTEIKRFKTGIELIEKYSIIREAFVYMNESFLSAAKGYDSWRLFQIVFIVSLILDIVAHEEDLALSDELKLKSKINDVDILYFPTGGGKTEAFLGILVFNLFFDRKREKLFGVTAILKYPLRLLSIQQVQRVSNILAKAELIRRRELPDGDAFSLGYFVGEKNTFNKIDNEVKKQLLETSQAELDESYRLLDVCPFCGEPTVHVVYDEYTYRLQHCCANKDCLSGGTIPLYMVDDEIYRFLPSVIISTVDKMTAVGMNMNFHNILCGAKRRCPAHGFTDKTDCLVAGCSENVDAFISIAMKDPAPTLLIQDELHLIKESLGAYDAHYETLIEYFIKELSGCNRGLKVIGATATISAYAEQAKHLYGKNAIQFPATSPYIDHNFYSYIDKNDIGRIIIGYAPFGKAIVNSVAYAVQYLKKVVWELYKNIDEIIALDGMQLGKTPEEKYQSALSLLQEYWIILEYNNVKMEGNRVLQAIEDPINPQLIAENVQSLSVKKMTGDDTFQEVRSILSQIEHANDILAIDFNMIVATSMISHGVDADRFNLMLFYGIPGSTAEYIQAYSRVGRKHTGIIIDIIRPAREKDQSYLRNFVKFHDYKDILVDAVAINRWAAKAIENTLPGVVSALILNYYRYVLQYAKETADVSKFKFLKTAIEQGKITAEKIKKHAYKIYQCSDADSSVGRLYHDKIDKLIDALFANLSSGSFDSKMYLTEVFNKCYFHVMMSLRDTDKQLLVELA